MAINIYIETSREEVAFLCDEVWDLQSQIIELEKWVETDGKNLNKGKYVADIGFSIRKEVSGGGGVLSSDLMRKMATLNLDIYFSEYNLENE